MYSCVLVRFCYCLVCFFFFKQKTAYEMRISDWSSDVCSSDLLGVGARVGGREEHLVAGEPIRLRMGGRHQQAVFERGVVNDLGGVELHGQEGRAEIGRASCRERVCQYV